MRTLSIPNEYQTNSLRENTNSVFNGAMSEDERPRSIRFPQWLWDEIDRDAARSKRSAVKQLEVVLTAYYRGEYISLDLERLKKIKVDAVTRLANQTINKVFSSMGISPRLIGKKRFEAKPGDIYYTVAAAAIKHKAKPNVLEISRYLAQIQCGTYEPTEPFLI